MPVAKAVTSQMYSKMSCLPILCLLGWNGITRIVQMPLTDSSRSQRLIRAVVAYTFAHNVTLLLNLQICALPIKAVTLQTGQGFMSVPPWTGQKYIHRQQQL
jgi:hypothetical protein